MTLPDFLAKPIFHIVYEYMRKQRGTPIPPMIRKVDLPPEEKRLAFDHLLESALQSGPSTPISYNLPYPKIDFLHYICDWRRFVVHGSPLQDLETLEPIRKSSDDNEFGNRQQIFCSPDAVWAMWFAILDKSKYGFTRNGCLRVGTGDRRLKYYHFELPKKNEADKPFTNGMIYICRAEDFPDKRPFPYLNLLNSEVEEWGSPKPVIPLAKMQVTPNDFPYLSQVQFSLE
ncbi:MAG: hypothetical protein Fur0017_25180 [Anaerolineales bacterium]